MNGFFLIFAIIHDSISFFKMISFRYHCDFISSEYQVFSYCIHLSESPELCLGGNGDQLMSFGHNADRLLMAGRLFFLSFLFLFICLLARNSQAPPPAPPPTPSRPVRHWLPSFDGRLPRFSVVLPSFHREFGRLLPSFFFKLLPSFYWVSI